MAWANAWEVWGNTGESDGKCGIAREPNARASAGCFAALGIEMGIQHLAYPPPSIMMDPFGGMPFMDKACCPGGALASFALYPFLDY